MKLLIDSCVWPPVRDALAADGHDVVSIADLPSDPGDDAILARAIAAQRTLITQDKDFGELAVRSARRHFGILRLLGFAARRQAGVCRLAVAHYERELIEGAIVAVEQGRVRVRLENRHPADRSGIVSRHAQYRARGDESDQRRSRPL